MNILDKFFVALGFQVDTDGIDKFEHKTEELRASILRLGALFTGAAVGIGLMVKEAAEGMGELKHFADLNQLTAEQVAAWNRVAALNFISQESAQDSLQTLNQRLGEAAVGLGRGRMIFQRLGLEARDASGHVKTLDQILGDVSDKMQKTGSRAANIAMARRLGLDPKFVPMLEKGREEYRKLREEAAKYNPLKEEDYERAEELNRNLVRARMTFTYLFQLAMSKLMPIMNNIIDKFVKWFDGFKGQGASMVVNLFEHLASLIENLLGWVELLWGYGDKLLGWLLKSKLATYAFAAGVALLISYSLGKWIIGITTALKTMALALIELRTASIGPVMILGALALALGLLIDDLYNYYQGNESVIGQLQKKFSWAVGIAEVAVGALSAVLGVLIYRQMASLIGVIIKLIPVLAGWASALWRVAAANIAATWEIALIVAAILALIGIVYMLWKYWDQYIADIKRWWHELGDAVDNFVTKIQNAIHWVKNLLHEMSAKEYFKMVLATATGGTAGFAYEAGQVAMAHPGAFQGPTGAASQPWLRPVTMHRSTSITVPSMTVISNDPDKAGDNVMKTFDKIHREATRDAQSGVGL